MREKALSNDGQTFGRTFRRSEKIGANKTKRCVVSNLIHDNPNPPQDEIDLVRTPGRFLRVLVREEFSFPVLNSVAILL